MMKVTPRAVERLKALVREHPEDPIVRVTVKDLDDHRLAFGITLEAESRLDDHIQYVEGLTVVLDSHSAPRMEGITLDYRDAEGFRFLHPESPEALTLLPPSLN